MTASNTPAVNEALLTRLRRIEGQVRGIARMLEDGRTCEDVVTQLMAVRSSIDTVGAAVLDEHLCACTQDKDPAAQVAALREAMKLWWRFAPSAGSAGPDPDHPGASSPLPLDRA
ncbi:MAG: metal-sensitive transcriptional regulator [Dehalococcoidia bacterium]|nr:metal-sensitive transcriptional regulator [Dehalococcoidia bacterium]